MCMSQGLKHRFYSGKCWGEFFMCVFVCLYSACNCVCMCMSANASRYHYLPSTSLALNVRAITCVCDSPLSQVLSLCSHMQPAHQESTVCRYSHTHMYACACTHTHTQLCPLVTLQMPFNNLHLAQTGVVVEGWRMKREGGISWGSSWLPAGPQNCRIIGMQRWMWHRPQCSEGGRTGVVQFKKPQSSWHGCGAVVEK